MYRRKSSIGIILWPRNNGTTECIVLLQLSHKYANFPSCEQLMQPCRMSLRLQSLRQNRQTSSLIGISEATFEDAELEQRPTAEDVEVIILSLLQPLLLLLLFNTSNNFATVISLSNVFTPLFRSTFVLFLQLAQSMKFPRLMTSWADRHPVFRKIAWN